MAKTSSIIQDIEFNCQKIMTINRDVVGCEILSRLPCGGDYVSTEEFFRVLSADDSLSITFRQLELAARIYETYSVVCSVNTDNSVLHSDSLTARLIEACKVRLCPVVLEFTEVRPLPPSDLVNSIFEELKGAGAQLALDDFGTGYNGMSVFANYDFDIVKLDKSLVQGLQKRPQKLKVLKHVLEMISSLKKNHVVEGVEDEDQLERLVDIGYTVFQGFLFHRPAPVEEML